MVTRFLFLSARDIILLMIRETNIVRQPSHFTDLGSQAPGWGDFLKNGVTEKSENVSHNKNLAR